MTEFNKPDNCSICGKRDKDIVWLGTYICHKCLDFITQLEAVNRDKARGELQSRGIEQNSQYLLLNGTSRA